MATKMRGSPESTGIGDKEAVLLAVMSERADGDPAHDLGHLRRVLASARRTAADEGPLAERRPLNDASYALDHFQTKLLKPTERMTATGAKISTDRQAFLLR